jgi:hypothetical protein
MLTRGIKVTVTITTPSELLILLVHADILELLLLE